MKLIVVALALCGLVQARQVDVTKLTPSTKDKPVLTEWQKVMKNLEPKVIRPIAPHPRTSRRTLVPVNGRIVGGDMATQGQFPWQVAVHLSDIGSFCGGSLISPTWIMFAAHCCDGSQFRIQLGVQNTNALFEAGRITVRTTTKFVHPDYDYDATGLDNDIALLQLDSPVTLTDIIQPIRLPRLSDAEKTFVGTNTTVSGWGFTSDEPTYTDELIYADEVVISNAECGSYIGGGPVGPDVLCSSGGVGKNTCFGDSGGPLSYIEDDAIRTQIGIVSWGIGYECEVAPASGFTRVTSYLPWISNVTGIEIRP